MVLEIPGKILGQSDVRESAIDSTAVTGTLYWSCSGQAFRPVKSTYVYDADHPGGITAGQDNLVLTVSVNLPHGGVVTAMVVYGSENDVTCQLEREEINLENSADIMASAVMGTEDTSISNATIDNSTYKYYMVVANDDTFDDNDKIYGARITYTI